MSYKFDPTESQGIFQDKANVGGGNPFTVLLWMKRPAPLTGDNGPLFIGDGATNNNGLFIQSNVISASDIKVNTIFNGPNDSLTIQSATYPSANLTDWNPVIVTYSPTVTELTQDFIAPVAGNVGNPGYPPNRTTLGYWGDSSPGEYFDGWLAHFAIWDRVLDAGEIFDLKSGANPLQYPTGLISYVPMISGLDDVQNYYENLQFVGLTPPVLSSDNPPVTRADIISIWKWSGDDQGGNPVYNATLENLSDGTTQGEIPTWIKINYAPPIGLGGGLIGDLPGGTQPGKSLLGKDQQGDDTGLTADLLGGLKGAGNDYDDFRLFP